MENKLLHEYMSRRLLTTLIILCLLIGGLAFKQEIIGFFQAVSEQISIASFSDQSQPSTALTTKGVINETNRYRQTEGLVALQYNEQLEQAAQRKLDDMFARQYFAHISPSGEGAAELAKEVNYQYIIVAENLALGNFVSDEELVKSWMDSPGHRENIMNTRYHEIGVAVGQGMYEGKITWLAVQEFGTAISVCGNFNESRETLLAAYKKQLTSWDSEIKRQQEALKTYKKGSEEYARAVEEYNTLVKKYNDLSTRTKRLIKDYNTEAEAYNACLEAFKE